MSNMRNAASVLVMSLSIILLMIPSNSVLAFDNPDDFLTDEPENNTIPLWGPRWCQEIVTWRIDNFEKITDSARNEMVAGIEIWSHNNPTGITLEEFNPTGNEKPDIIIKFKKGGGRVQGQALQQSDSNGCFTSVKISVSGKAFGRDNPGDQVKSITMQEVGHGLGLLHSDNTKDVMYGTVQSTPNVKLSQCDITAWIAVQANTGPIEVCNPTDTGGDTGSVTPTSIDITHGQEDTTASKDVITYPNRDTVHIIVQLDVNEGGIPVHVTIDAPKSNLSGDTTTNDSGQAHIHYKVNAGRDGTGTYHIYAEVDGLSCNDESLSFNGKSLCHADFDV